jgi:hypothetical protein
LRDINHKRFHPSDLQRNAASRGGQFGLRIAFLQSEIKKIINVFWTPGRESG